MRLNKYIAQNTDLSRRKADEAIAAGQVTVNGQAATLGMSVGPTEVIGLNGRKITPKRQEKTTILLNKPVGYVCSKDGQGSPTIYDLLPAEYKSLNIAGRLDKDSSGLVILTNDGDLLYELTHPSNTVEKVYQVTLNRELSPDELRQLTGAGVDMGDDRASMFKNITQTSHKQYQITLVEGRNRQIRRTFASLNHQVLTLARTRHSDYSLDQLLRQDKAWLSL